VSGSREMVIGEANCRFTDMNRDEAIEAAISEDWKVWVEAAVALSQYTDDEALTWIVRFLLD